MLQKLRCPRGHYFTAYASNVRFGRVGCPECKRLGTQSTVSADADPPTQASFDFSSADTASEPPAPDSSDFSSGGGGDFSGGGADGSY